MRDANLVEQLLSGDRAAWRGFFAAVDPFVRAAIVRATRGALGDEDAREIRGQFWLSLLDDDMAKLRAFDPERSRLTTWVSLLAAHCAVDWLRPRHRRPSVETLDIAERLPSDGVDPFELTALVEHAHIARLAMDALTERDRAFAQLYFVAGLSAHQVARSMRISVATVYSKKHKVKARLAQAIAQIGAGT